MMMKQVYRNINIQQRAARPVSCTQYGYAASPQPQRKRRKSAKSGWIIIAFAVLMLAVFMFVSLSPIIIDKIFRGVDIIHSAGNGAQSYLAGGMQETPQDTNYELQQLLERNPETEDYVKGYANKDEYIGKEFSYEVQKGTMPHLLQWDSRWGYDNYGNMMMGLSGCAPTCLAMVSAQLTGNPENNPLSIAQMSESKGYYIQGKGTAWSLLSEGCQEIGLVAQELPLDETSVKNSLNEGRPIICSVGPGDFTTQGHFIVLYQVAENGLIAVKDPNSIERSNKLWDFNTLAPQIRNLWSYSSMG